MGNRNHRRLFYLAALSATMLRAQADLGATFRAATQEVQVDAVVVDKKGNFQGDLTRESFHLFEDGKEQNITSFSLAGAPGTGHSKHFVALVFDSEEPGLREGVMDFVDRNASPDLYFAVFARVATDEMRLQQAFTTDAAKIRAALRAMQVSKEPPIKGTTPVHNPFTTRISGVADALSAVTGRKAMILFSYGFFGRGLPATRQTDSYSPRVNWPEEWLKMIDECNANNVSVYSFIEGPKQRANATPHDFYDRGRDPRANPRMIVDLVEVLATSTGGKYAPPGIYDLSDYLGSITAGQSDYYLLGYTPSQENASKPCHKLSVKVDRAGLNVDARDTYCTSAQFAPHALKPPQKALEAYLASGAPGSLSATMQLSWFYTKPGMPIVDAAMDLDPRAIKMHGKLHGEVSVVGAVYRQDGSAAARLADTVTLDFDTPAQLEAFLKVPYHYSHQFSVEPGQYRFRVATGAGDSAFGSVEKTLDIQPWSGQSLSVSGIALGTKDYPLTGLTAELDNSLLEGPHRLASQGRLTVPMGGNEFHAGANGIVYFEVYGTDKARTLSIRLRIVDRGTGTQQNDSGPIDASGWMLAANPALPIALTLPLSDLPVGAYRLEVSVTGGSKPGAVVRAADFEVK